MDNELLELCEKACIEYCENGYVSESVFNSLMKDHEVLTLNDSETMKAYMRNFIKKYIQNHNLPWRSNTCISSLTSLGICYSFILSELPKEIYIV